MLLCLQTHIRELVYLSGCLLIHCVISFMYLKLCFSYSLGLVSACSYVSIIVLLDSLILQVPLLPHSDLASAGYISGSGYPTYTVPYRA